MFHVALAMGQVSSDIGFPFLHYIGEMQMCFEDLVFLTGGPVSFSNPQVSKHIHTMDPGNNVDMDR